MFNRGKMITLLFVGVLAVAAVFGAFSVRSALAAAPDQSGVAHLGGGRGIPGGVSDEYLAEALGISVDELDAAYQEAKAGMLEAAVEAGLITQAQADELNESGRAFPFGRHWSGWLSQSGIDYEALLAEALDISVEELQAAYSQAYNARIDQAVEDGDLSEEKAGLMKGRYALHNDSAFQSAMQSAFEAAVNQAVANGVITQAQAEQILQSGNGLRFPGFGWGGGFYGGGFGRHGRGGGFEPPVTPESTTAPSNGL